MQTLCIIGLGNELREDDGVGLAVLRRLKKAFPGRAAVRIPVRDQLFEIPRLIMNYSKVILIDAAPPDSFPGKVSDIRYRVDRWPASDSYSLHDLDILWQLRYAYRAGFTGEILMIGIEAASLSCRKGLSPELQRSLPGAVETVKRMIARFDPDFKLAAGTLEELR